MEETALVLEGGGLRGQYTAGVLDAFIQAGLEFPYVIGVSAGASIGSSLVSKQFGRNREIVKRYRSDKRYLSLRNMVTTGSLFGMDFIYKKVALDLIPFDFKTFQASKSRFVSVCTDCKTGTPVYFEKDADLLTVLRASSSMPFLSPMVNYLGQQLLDGAVTDSIPFKKTQLEGFKKILVILTRPAGYRKKKSASWPAKLKYHGYPKLSEAINNRWQMYNQTLDEIENLEEKKEIQVIRPSENLHISRTEKSIEKLEALYLLGLKDGQNWLSLFYR